MHSINNTTPTCHHPQVVYPGGMGGMNGFCSLLVNAPEGAFLKGSFSMGKQVRETP